MSTGLGGFTKWSKQSIFIHSVIRSRWFWEFNKMFNLFVVTLFGMTPLQKLWLHISYTCLIVVKHSSFKIFKICHYNFFLLIKKVRANNCNIAYYLAIIKKLQHLSYKPLWRLFYPIPAYQVHYKVWKAQMSNLPSLATLSFLPHIINKQNIWKFYNFCMHLSYSITELENFEWQGSDHFNNLMI